MTHPSDQLDPELAAPLQGFLGALGGGLDLGNAAAARATMDGILSAVKAQAPPLEGVDARDVDVPGLDGAAPVRVRVFTPSPRGEQLPALLWMHAGGWVIGSVDLDALAVAQLAKDTECVVVSVDYRLAPEHPFPAPLYDCRAALRWLYAESASLGVDAERIAVGGSSAGANLAAALALMTRDEGDIRPAFQLLIYPALDDRAAGPAAADRAETLFLSRQNVIDAWRAYLGDAAGGDAVPAYAAPARAQSLRGLPPAYIAVGTLDPFLDENMEYARRLLADGVAAELHVYPGACHAFDVFGVGSRIGQQFIAERNAVLRRALHPALASPSPAA